MKIYKKYFDKNYKHIIYEFCGIKFAVKNPFRDLYQRVLGINKLLNFVVDINNLQKAKGTLREQQNKLIEIFKYIDNICQQNNLRYWIDFGTLIGAIRHKGFIPWDDDIDICMLREDYKKIYTILKKEIQNSDYILCEQGCLNNVQIVISYKYDTSIKFDIFPIDSYHTSVLTEQCQKEISSKFNFVRSRIKRKFHKKSYNCEEFYRIKIAIEKYMHNVGLTNFDNNTENPILFFGADFAHEHKIKAFEYQDIFPLKKAPFEDIQVYIPNKYDKHLTDLYGNWQSFPEHFESIAYFYEGHNFDNIWRNKL